MDFLELVIASERLAQWVDTLHLSTQPRSCRSALLEMAEAVASKPSYAEEARRAKAPAIVTGLMRMFAEDEEATNAISSILSSCAGVLAASAKVQEYQLEGHIIRIHEGLLGDGVGTRVWAVATTLCRELAAYPGIVREQEVLEIGSGCGLTGIFAAKMGAKRVTLTDFLPKVLENLSTCMHANASRVDMPADAVVDEDFDPEDEFDSQFEVDNMRVRLLDWAEGTVYQDKSVSRDTILGEQAFDDDCGEEGEFEMPPELETGKSFPVIIGTDIIYEPLHAELVANVVSRRLAPGGRCILCCGVRIQNVFDTFFARIAGLGLRMWKEPVSPAPRHGEVMGRECEYEGGFLLLAIDWQEHPAQWHRSDIFSSLE